MDLERGRAFSVHKDQGSSHLHHDKEVRIPKNKQMKKEVRALPREQESYTVRYKQHGNKRLRVGLHWLEETLGGSVLYDEALGLDKVLNHKTWGTQKDIIRATISHRDTRSGPLLS